MMNSLVYFLSLSSCYLRNLYKVKTRKHGNATDPVARPFKLDLRQNRKRLYSVHPLKEEGILKVIGTPTPVRGFLSKGATVIEEVSRRKKQDYIQIYFKQK